VAVEEEDSTGFLAARVWNREHRAEVRERARSDGRENREAVAISGLRIGEAG
jgi:hypothetical protein